MSFEACGSVLCAGLLVDHSELWNAPREGWTGSKFIDDRCRAALLPLMLPPLCRWGCRCFTLRSVELCSLAARNACWAHSPSTHPACSQTMLWCNGCAISLPPTGLCTLCCQALHGSGACAPDPHGDKLALSLPRGVHLHQARTHNRYSSAAYSTRRSRNCWLKPSAPPAACSSVPAPAAAAPAVQMRHPAKAACPAPASVRSLGAGLCLQTAPAPGGPPHRHCTQVSWGRRVSGGVRV